MRFRADSILLSSLRVLLATVALTGGADELLAQTPVTIWPDTAVPSSLDVGPSSPLELGVTFTADTNGSIAGIRFYKSPGNTGRHVAHLWKSTGTLLATATFNNESASGWQYATFPTPVPITAGNLYVASYHSTMGHWSVDWYYFTTAGADNAPLHAPADATGTPNGRFAYGGGTTFPANTHASANYWVDVMFIPGAAAAAPSITAQPASTTVTEGQTASFSVAALGTAPLGYQWAKNGAPITGATSSVYTTAATTTANNGNQFSVVVSNSAGSVTSATATLTVTPKLQISTSQLSNGAPAVPYTATLNAYGGSLPYAWSLVGQLPPGLALNAGGAISGTPSLAGSFPFVVQVNDAGGQSASKSFSISIVAPAPTIVITSPVSGATVSGNIAVSGTATDTLSISSVQVAVDAGNYVNASGTNSWTFGLNTSSLTKGPHTLTAKTTDSAGVSATSVPVAISVNNGAGAGDCTLFASASGNDGNDGATPSTPKTLAGAAAATSPGAVVCMLGGTYSLSYTFYPPVSGTPNAWIVYKNYGDGPVNLVWAAGAIGQPMVKFGNGTFPDNPSYLEFRGLNLDGQNTALDGFFCFGAHHLRFIGNRIDNTGGSGVGAVRCDYLTSDHNLINHNGYLYGWTSAISYNSAQWLDTYPGFHNIISNNIIAGEYDGSTNHTDGNGIILDLSNGSYDYSTANTPPALIINNVVYGNGGRCIQAFVVTNFWVVNNTCYKNNLDTSLGNAGSFVSSNSHDGYFINNMTVAWHSNNPSFDQGGTNANIAYYADLYAGSAIDFSYSDPSQFLQADPLFVDPPVFDPIALGQYATALAPSLLGNGLTLSPLSPAYNRGIDPSLLPGAPAAIVSDLLGYIYTDINGVPRPTGGGSDLGAYQH